MATKNTTPRLILHIVLFALFVLVIGGNLDSVAQTSNSYTSGHAQQSDWQLLDHSEVVEVTQHLSMPLSHSLSYQTVRNNCSEAQLKIRLVATASDLQQYVGSTIRMNMFFGKQRAMIYLPVQEFYALDENHYIVEMAEFHINEQLRRDLLNHETMVIDILEPTDLTDKLISSNANFSLSGLHQSRDLINRLCQSSPDNDEASYALVYDLL